MKAIPLVCQICWKIIKKGKICLKEWPIANFRCCNYFLLPSKLELQTVTTYVNSRQLQLSAWLLKLAKLIMLLNIIVYQLINSLEVYSKLSDVLFFLFHIIFHIHVSDFSSIIMFIFVMRYFLFLTCYSSPPVQIQKQW